MSRAPFSVAVVGRPNVGKSTLFNRIVGERVSIVDDTPGVTRDTVSRVFEWNGVPIRFLDTGGYETTGRGEIEVGVRRHIEEAIELADALVLVVDITTGPTPEDEEAVAFIRRTGRPLVVAVNKADNAKREEEGFADFLAWGFETIFPVSALHGHGTGDLLDAIVDRLPELPAEPDAAEEEELVRVAIVGRPNVGKSTLLNRLAGEERSIVTSIPGTTRDPVDTLVRREGKSFLLIDTAGIRRRGKIQGLEKFAVARGRIAVERADVALLLIDAEEKVTETDAHVFGEVNDAGRAAVILVNKWDSVAKETSTAGAYAKEIREKLKFLRHCPILFVSALSGQRTHRIWEEILKAHESYTRRIRTAELNQRLAEWVEERPPHGIRGRHPKILYMTQIGIEPPTFSLFVRNPDTLHFSYRRHLVNRIRETFEFAGAPVRILVREATRRDLADRTEGR